MKLTSQTHLGKEIKKLRKADGLSQERLGYLTGVTQACISRIESRGTVDLTTLYELSVALGLTITVSSGTKVIGIDKKSLLSNGLDYETKTITNTRVARYIFLRLQYSINGSGNN